jgi:Domain of unknown function (DUF4157)
VRQRRTTKRAEDQRSEPQARFAPPFQGRDVAPELRRKGVALGSAKRWFPAAQSVERRSGEPAATTLPPVVRDVLRSPGEPLETDLRAFMEPRFGHDFSQVRVHTDARAVQSARSVDALAYTVGQHIVFGANQSSAGTGSGRHLIAHELAHTLQNRNAATLQHPSEVGPANGEHELEADQIAKRAMNSALARPASRQLDASTVPEIARPRSRSVPPLVQRAPAATLGTVLAPQMAVDALKPNARGFDVSTLSVDLLKGIMRAESGVLKDRVIESSEVGDTQGPGQLGEAEINEVDKTFVTARNVFAASYGEPPETWQEKTNDPNWACFYTAGTYLLKLEVAQKKLQPSEEQMAKEGAAGTRISDEAMGIHELGLVTYHGGFDRMAAYRRRIAGDPPSATAATPEEAAFRTRFGISPGFKRWQVSNEMALAAIREGLFMQDDEDRAKLAEMEAYLQNVAGGFDFEFDISVQLEASRRFFVSQGTVTIESSAHFPEGVPGTAPANSYEYSIQLYSDSSDLLSSRVDYAPAIFQVGEKQSHQWTSLPPGHYRFSVYRVYKHSGPILHGVGKVEFD